MPPPPPQEMCTSGANQFTPLAPKRTPRAKTCLQTCRLDFFFFIFYFTRSCGSALRIATLTPASWLVETSFYLLLSTPSHVIDWTQPRFGPSAGLYQLSFGVTQYATS